MLRLYAPQLLVDSTDVLRQLVLEDLARATEATFSHVYLAFDIEDATSVSRVAKDAPKASNARYVAGGDRPSYLWKALCVDAMSTLR